MEVSKNSIICRCYNQFEFTKKSDFFEKKQTIIRPLWAQKSESRQKRKKQTRVTPVNKALEAQKNFGAQKNTKKWQWSTGYL